MDPINSPSHYIAETPDGRRIEVIEIIEAYGLGYHLGNVVKYICRSGRKTADPRPDLRKAIKYLEFAAKSMLPLGLYVDELRRNAPLPRDIAAAYGLDVRRAQALGIVLQAFPHRTDMADAAAHLTAALGEIEDEYEASKNDRLDRMVALAYRNPHQLMSELIEEVIDAAVEKDLMLLRKAAADARESGEISEIEHARRMRALGCEVPA